MRVRVKIKRVSWVFISAYGPGSEKMRYELNKYDFWYKLNECVRSFGRN